MSPAPPNTFLYLGIGLPSDSFHKYGNVSKHTFRRQVLAGGFLSATLATFARSLPVPLDAISFSLHRPLRGTPRCAPRPRKAYAEELPYFRNGLLSVCRCRQGGFTLLELIVVLFLAGLVAALVAPSFSGTLESARLRSSAAEVRAALTLARTLAASGSRVRAVSFDAERGEYAVDGEARKYLLPEGIRIASARVGTGTAVSELFRVRFFPDGSAEGAEIVVASSAGGRLRVTVDPLTGIVEAGI